MSDIYSELAKNIIEAQEGLIGPVAVSQAQKVSGLTINWDQNHDVTVTSQGVAVIDQLVGSYKELFGQISVEVCKEAAARLVRQLDTEELPASLR